MRKINRAGEGHSPAPAGRKVNVSNSRRESQPEPKHGREPKEPKEPREKGRHPILRFIGRTIATLICLGIMAGSLVAVGAVYYVVQATANDGDLLDLDNIELSQSSVVMATDPDTGAQVEYATLRSSNSHRVWADLEQIPRTCSMRSSAPRIRTFTTSPASTSSAPSAQWSTIPAAHLQLQAGCIHAGAAADQEPDRRQERQRH